MLMLSFILLLNAFAIFYEKLPALQDDPLSQQIVKSNLDKDERRASLKRYSPDPYEEISLSDLPENKKGILIWLQMLGLVSLFIFGLGLFLDIRIIMARLQHKEILKSEDAHLKVEWDIWDIFRLVVIFIFFAYILQMIEAQFTPFFVQDQNSSRVISLANTGVMDLLILGLIIYFVTIKYKQTIAALGLKLKNAVRLVFLAMLSYIALLPILAFLFLLQIIITGMFNYTPEEHTLFRLFFQEENSAVLIISAAMVAFIGPIAEEVFFRGFAYNALKKKWGAGLAMSLSAVIFAALHANLFGFLPIMLLGFLLVFIYEKTGSLITSITIHILHNSLLLGFLFLGKYLGSLGQ